MKDAKGLRVVTQAMLEHLPAPVQRYMHYTGVIGKPWIYSVAIKQTGRLRQSIEKAWMPMSARQVFTTAPPSFTWRARFRMGGIPLLSVKDEYRTGHGQMMAKLMGLITIFDIQDEKLDQGAMLRYLGEMIWFPVAYLGENITWEAVDDASANVTLNDSGKSVTGRMFFDEEGRPTNFTAKRYREVEGSFSLDDWSTPIRGYATLAGLNLPNRGQAVWNLPSGDFAYIDLEIRDIHYNSAE